MRVAQSSHLPADRDHLAAILSDRRARRLLARLHAASGPLTVRDLAVSLTAREQECASTDVTDAQREQRQCELHHNYIPRLRAAGIIDQTADGQIRFCSLGLERFDVDFPSLAHPDDPSWTAAATVMARSYRYPLVSLLVDEASISLSRLATRLADTDPTVSNGDPTPLAVVLHHVDLPKLDDTGVVTYNPQTQTVEPTAVAETLL